ncbi:MAG: class I adenylate-forming enzyme family protein, partial [Betaproteobacteria bacterium]
MTAATADLIREAHGYGTTTPDSLLVDFQSLGALFELRAREQPDALFLKYFDDECGETATYSYRRFFELVLRAATLLASHGLRAGDCFATLSHNHPVAAALLFAGWKLGLLVAPLNASEDDGRIAFVLRDAAAKLIIAHPALMARAMRVAGEVAMPQIALTFDDMLASNNMCDHVDTDYRRHPALIVYTSGTTGNPKGVALSQYNMMINAQGICAWHSLNETSRLMCVLPIHHVNGIVVTLVTTVMAGSAVILNRSFKVSTFWKHLAEERVEIVSVVPTILQFLYEANEDISGLDLSRFRHFICGAGTLAISLVEKFEARFGLTVLHGYGLSETTAFTCTLPVGLPQGVRKQWLCNHGYPSIGSVFPHCEMAIHDPDGRSLRPKERGEIVIRGHYIMNGYHQRPDANADAF